MELCIFVKFCFFFQAEDGIRDLTVTGVQTCALPISACATWPSLKYISHFSLPRLSVSEQLLRPISRDCTRSITFICERLPRTTPSEDEVFANFSSEILSMTRLMRWTASLR